MKHQPILSAAILLGFILGSFKGYVALWKDGNPDPIQIFPCAVDTFPDADRAALTEGIYARSEMELNQILEAYLS